MGTAVSLEPGMYEVTEIAPDRPSGLIAVDPVFSPDCSGDIQAGEELSCTIANKFTEYVFLTKWGSQGSGDGQFDAPEAIAVDPSTGNVFVADTSNDRVQVFVVCKFICNTYQSLQQSNGLVLMLLTDNYVRVQTNH